MALIPASLTLPRFQGIGLGHDVRWLVWKQHWLRSPLSRLSPPWRAYLWTLWNCPHGFMQIVGVIVYFCYTVPATGGRGVNHWFLGLYSLYLLLLFLCVLRLKCRFEELVLRWFSVLDPPVLEAFLTHGVRVTRADNGDTVRFTPPLLADGQHSESVDYPSSQRRPRLMARHFLK